MLIRARAFVRRRTVVVGEDRQRACSVCLVHRADLPARGRQGRRAIEGARMANV